jgi:hypothetical protein
MGLDDDAECAHCRWDKCTACEMCWNPECPDFYLECGTCEADRGCGVCSKCRRLVCAGCGEHLDSPGCSDYCGPNLGHFLEEVDFCLTCDTASSHVTLFSNDEGSLNTKSSPRDMPPVETTQGDLPADLTDVVAELKSLRAEAKNLEVRQAELREVILERMGDQVDGKVDGRVVLKIVRGVRKSFDSKRFIKERPQEAIEYLSETETVTVRTM